MKLFHKQYHSPGTQPGIIQSRATTQCSLSFTQYSKTEYKTNSSNSEQQDLSQLMHSDVRLSSQLVTWLHVQGEPGNDLLSAIAKQFELHELLVEDVANVGQRPKTDINEEQVFVILNLPHIQDGNTKLEQVSLFLSKQVLVSFCTGPFNPFDKISQRLKTATGKLRKQQADYLMYGLIDTVIDYGFPLLESYSDRIEAMEDELSVSKNNDMLSSIHQLRKELLLVRRRMWPQREVINELLRNEECELLSHTTLIHLKDCHDHTLSIMEMLETYHEMTSGLMELYLTTVSMRLNDIMKFLTVFTTIFIPPTLLVGIYGMNFNSAASAYNMPELNWEYGYVAAWALIVLMISGMLLFFRKKHWI